MPKFEVVILDIDGTLTPNVSWYAFTKGLGASVHAHRTIYDTLKAGKITYETSKQQLIALWHTTGNANRAYISKLFESWQFYPKVEQTVAEIKKAGYRLCINHRFF